jgi:hypothetical protein
MAGAGDTLPTGGSGGAGAGGAGAGAATGGSPGTGGAAGSAPGGAGGAHPDGAGGGVSGGGSGAAGSTAGAGGHAACPALPSAPLPAASIIQFNDNGAWSWMQDERAIVDAAGGKFVIGSIASGGTRDGDIEAVVHDIATGRNDRYTLGNVYANDHDSPVLLARPDGKYLATFVDRQSTCASYSAIFDGSSWTTPATTFDWTALGCPWGGVVTETATYPQLFSLSAESATYALFRSVADSPELLVSADNGASFRDYGLLMTVAIGDVGGYYKYWSNGTDRVDIVATEAHPRDYDNNLWHGYFQGGALHDSTGTIVDSVVADRTASRMTSLTQVLAAESTLGGVTLGHFWMHDIVRYPDGTIALTGQARVTGSPDATPDLRAIYARWSGGAWHATYLGKAGPSLDSNDTDYTGLTALHPDNPDVLFFSTTVDPRDGTTQLGKHELFAGVTCDDGASWTWAPLTQGSSADNLRPIVPKWDAGHTLLLWLQGTYPGQDAWQLQVVGTTAVGL